MDRAAQVRFRSGGSVFEWLRRYGTERQQMAQAQREFLPGALAVQDRPPSPAGRWLLWLLMALVCIGTAWATLGEIDIVVSAPGRIVPSGKVKIVQAPDTAVVAAIHVRDGQTVRAGEVLISLEDTAAQADALRVSEQLANGARELLWRKALESWLALHDGGAAMAQRRPDDVADSDNSAMRILQHKKTEIAARLRSLNQDLSANSRERESVVAEHERAVARPEIVRERVLAYSTLVEKQYGARVQYLEMLEQQTDLEKTLPMLLATERKLLDQAESIGARISATRSEIRARNLLEIERLNAESAMLQQDARKATEQQRRQVLRAPVAGTIQELAIHTTGAVTTPAQPLMKIVPDGAMLEVETLLQNKDIGFVHAGQHVAVKVDSFNFTKYGLLDAEVSAISNDAIEEKGVGWVFRAHMKLAKDEIIVAGDPVKLSPGMSVMTEINIGKRRLIEFFLSPLLRYKQESVGER